MAPKRVARRFRRRLREDYPAVVVLAVYLAGLGLVFYLGHQDRVVGRERDRAALKRLAASDRQQRKILAKLETVRVANCVLRRERKASVAELKQQVRRTRAFLKRFPDGLPNIHVSRSDIEQSIRSQEANIKLQQETVKALAVVRCGK